MITLLRYDPIRRVQILGEMWKATKNDKTLSCEVRTNPQGWELRAMIQFQLQRSQVCTTDAETNSVSETWLAEAVAKGWERL